MDNSMGAYTPACDQQSEPTTTDIPAPDAPTAPTISTKKRTSHPTKPRTRVIGEDRAVMLKVRGKGVGRRMVLLDREVYEALTYRYRNAWTFTSKSGHECITGHLRRVGESHRGAKPEVKLARLIMGAKPSQAVRLKNGNPFDLRRANLDLVNLPHRAGAVGATYSLDIPSGDNQDVADVDQDAGVVAAMIVLSDDAVRLERNGVSNGYHDVFGALQELHAAIIAEGQLDVSRAVLCRIVWTTPAPETGASVACPE